jgi:tRNA-2-methylthio-N6-dimethylallyladenosine synthase
MNFCSEVKDYFEKEEPKAFVRVFGCQQNEADGEKIRGFLQIFGFSFVVNIAEADLLVVNTCAVRHTAEDRIFGFLGELKCLKTVNPRVFIAVGGCMTEQMRIREKIKKNYPFVDLIFGAKSLEQFPKLFYSKIIGKKKFDSFAFNESEPLLMNKFKASVPIISGCNNFCSYCIVPYVRGREKSVPKGEILAKIKKLVKNGCKDITLLGQNVNSYGNDFDGNYVNFSRLLREIDEIPNDFILRFMTSHPKDFSDELIETLARSKHFCGHIHLPPQSGSNVILAKMNRKYTCERYLEITRKIKRLIPRAVITGDIIVGFPGETKKDFEKTLDLIREVKFASIFSFIYSPRANTPAASMEDFATHAEKAERIKILLEVQKEITENFLKDLKGVESKCLVEKVCQNESLARLPNNVKIRFLDVNLAEGDLIRARITGHERGILIGEVF